MLNLRDPYRIGQTDRLAGDRFVCGDCGQVWLSSAVGPPFEDERCGSLEGTTGCGGRLTAVWDVYPGS